MTHDDAVAIVVRAGKEGQKEILEALFEEMSPGDLATILKKNGFEPTED